MGKKVCQILFSGLGGHGSVVFSLLDADTQQQWDSSLLFYGNEPVRQEYIDYCEKKGIAYGAVLKKPGISADSYMSVYRFLKQQQPDVIILHSPSLILVAAWFCFLRKTKLILVEHNPLQIKRRSEWICSYLSMFLCHRVVYLTDQYAQEMKQKLAFFFRQRRTVIIPNGIDTALFSEGRKDEGSPLRITMIARFSSGKDQHTLLMAFAQLKQQLSGNPVELYLAGDGDTLEGLKKIAASQHIPDVVFPGMLSEPAIIQVLKATDIYVHSTLSETMSTAIMQALSCGLPVIASDIPGVNNLVSNENGMLFPEKNINVLTDKMIRLINDEAERKALGKKARRYAEEHLSSAKMFASYNNIV